MSISISKIGLAVILTFMPFAVMAKTADQVVNASNAFAPETIPSQNVGVVYFDLTNNDTIAHSVVSMTSSSAEMVQLHHNVITGGKSHMAPMEKLDIQPHTTQSLSAGGTHVMLLNLKQPLKTGDHVALTLQFEDGSKEDIIVPVQKASQ